MWGFETCSVSSLAWPPGSSRPRSPLVWPPRRQQWQRRDGRSASAAATCDEARTDYAEAKANRDEWRHRLARARKQLHQAHAHGTAAEFQQAKNKVRRAKGKVFDYQTAMNQAAAQVAALC